MPESLTCPNCSAPLDVLGDGSTTMRCPYCKSSVIIPQELRVSENRSSGTSPMSSMEIEEKLRPIREKAIAGETIEAIRQFRETFSIGLKDAKGKVEAMQRGEDIDVEVLILNSDRYDRSKALDAAVVKELIDLINSGDKLNAIRLFQEKTGAGLKDAKDVIDGMETGLSAREVSDFSTYQPTILQSSFAIGTAQASTDPRSRRRWLGVSFFLFILVTVLLPIMVGLTSRGGPLAGMWARINPFAPGVLTLQFGKEGTGPGYFTNPRFVAVDNLGHIYVGEMDGGRIQVFDEEGKYLTQWRATGNVTGDVYLTGMAADRNGSVYTTVGSDLFVYDGLSGEMLNELEHPDGWGFDDVSIDASGRIVASWYKNRDDIIRFDKSGAVDLWVQNAISNITNDSELDMRVAVDGIGNIYILAYFNEGVFLFDQNGKYISRFGSMGEAKGQFTSPRSIAVDNQGKVYIADFPGVMIYASDGRYLDTLPINGAVMGIAFDDNNNLYMVADEKVLRYRLK